MNHSRRISYRLLAAALVILTALSCAKTNPPGGGPRDVDPPVVLKSQPPEGTLNFTGNSFTITFDEYVVLDRINEKFMVSPPTTTPPDVKLKGKSMIVRWEDKLTDSTTYTFFFQDAIRDNNENNPIPNFQYVFSTGPVLDSLTLTGNIFDAANLEIVEDVTVILHSNLSDTAPRTLLPAYISRPDPSGGFTISNIRPGRYRLFALKDLNGNTLYDLDDETFAFCDSIIEITPDNYYGLLPDTVSYSPPAAPPTARAEKYLFGLHRLYAFRQAPDKQYLQFTGRKSAWLVDFGLALPTDSGEVSVEITDAGSESWYLEHNAARDTFMIWITDPEIYNREQLEALITYPYTDSTDALVSRSDTLSFRYVKPAAPRGGTGRPQPLTITTNLAGKVRPGTMPLFRAATPLAEPDTTLIRLTRMVDSVITVIPYHFVRDTLSSQRLTMRATLTPGESYSLLCDRGAFTDIYGLQNDSVMYRINVAGEEDYGSISMILTGYEGEVIVQLLTSGEKLLRETPVEAPGTASFLLLEKGSYRLKVIYDLDGNGRWTPGDYRYHRLPEPVSYYPTELEVKANWALEQEWEISIMNAKDVSLREKPTIKGR